ncbi:hypothetical protein [Streptomyces sp. NRRL S-87]|nr:hypothetical protein [Streptomyces sp. NRRL S-87]
MLITRRVTADTEGGPLILEELRANASITQAEFTITATKGTVGRRP